MAVKDDQQAPLPAGLGFDEAASLPLAGLTAWQALDAAKVAPGDHVLITAGAGGVGSLAVQLAKARGARVTATCGPKNVDFVRGLGADEVVDYTKGVGGRGGEGRGVGSRRVCGRSAWAGVRAVRGPFRPPTQCLPTPPRDTCQAPWQPRWGTPASTPRST